MFIDSDNIKVSIYYRQIRNGNTKVVPTLEDIPEEDRPKFTELVLEMKPMSWKVYNDLQRRCIKSLGPGMGDELDWVKYKEEKLIAVLAGWNAKDKDGKAVPVNKENIFRLHPRIAETALNEFDRLTLLGEEDRKNS